MKWPTENLRLETPNPFNALLRFVYRFEKARQPDGNFTKNAKYKVYIGDMLVSDLDGTDNLAKAFGEHASQVKTYFTLNRQHSVEIDGDQATGISFSQIKMVRATEDVDVLTDYSVIYRQIYKAKP